jgi:hypothetical protein
MSKRVHVPEAAAAAAAAAAALGNIAEEGGAISKPLILLL